MQFVHHPAGSTRLGDFLIANLERPWDTFRAAIAFVKRSGSKHIVPALAKFAKSHHAEIISGVSLGGTSKEGLEDLLGAMSGGSRVVIFHNENGSTFHPKIYLFRSQSAADVLIGSGNLTEGGLYSNYEASFRIELDLRNPAHRDLLKSIEDVLDEWASPGTGTAHVLDATFLNRLVALGYVPPERLSTPDSDEERIRNAVAQGMAASVASRGKERLFSSLSVPRAPASGRIILTPGGGKSRVQPAQRGTGAATLAGTTGFVMTLQQTDVGVGQTTGGTSRRSPEIFIPLSARDANPLFWGWDKMFKQDRLKPGKYDRQGVKMRIGANMISVNMMTWPDKHDFRLRSEALRSAGNIGDIMRIEKVDPASGAEYYVEVVPQGTTQYPTYLQLCSNAVRNSKKKFGYY